MCGQGYVCDKLTNTCVFGCYTNLDCYPGLPICDTKLRSCRSKNCLDADMPCNPGYVCDSKSSNTPTCIPGCNSNSDCPGYGSYCNTATRQCITPSCLNPGYKCSDSFYCNMQTNPPSCTFGCLSNADCGNSFVCDIFHRWCRLSNCLDPGFECGPRFYCDIYSGYAPICKPGCLTNYDCPSGNKCDVPSKQCLTSSLISSSIL